MVRGESAVFDVICAGEALWRTSAAPRAVRLPRAGLFEVARRLARSEVRVGLATVVEDDRAGRAALAELTSLGVDTSGVQLAAARRELVIVDAAGAQCAVTSEQDGAGVTDFEVPREWSSRVLLLSGLSPVTAQLAAYCKAARSARRRGALVVLDVVGSLRRWAGRDARMIAMVLREADVVRCSLLDLAVLGTDPAAVRASLRASATLVVHDDAATTASGAFGEVRVRTTDPSSAAHAEACTAAICAEHARPKRLAETASARWHRILGGASPRT